MLETLSERLSRARRPALRLARQAARRGGSRRSTPQAEARVPFTTGILIGIGETRAERIDALLAIRELGERHGHVQEVIVQNFRAKPGTRMAGAPGAAARRAALDDRRRAHRARCRVARPGAAEPVLRRLPATARRRDRRLGRRLAGHDRPRQPGGAVARGRAAARGDREPRASSSRRGLPSTRSTSPSSTLGRPGVAAARAARRRRGRARARGRAGRRARLERRSRSAAPARDRVAARRSRPTSSARTRSRALPRARPRSAQRVLAAADALRREVNGDDGHLRRHAQRQLHERLLLPLRLLRVLEGQARGEPARRAVPRAARRDRPPLRGGVGARRDRGLPPGRDPSRRSPATTTSTSARAIKDAVPGLHVHAFSALEVWQGAATLGLPLEDYLPRLRDAGLGSLPGTAAEILDDEVRARDLPGQGHDRAVARGARRRAPRRACARRRRSCSATSTAPRSWARHLLRAARAAAAHAAASRSSCRSRSCTWRRRSTLQGPRAPRADVRRGAARARGRAARPAPVDHERPGVVGEARARGRRRSRCGPASTTSAGR